MHVAQYCPHEARAAAEILNKLTGCDSPAAGKQQVCELSTLISLCCHSVCCLLSITEWVYHTSDGVSTTVVWQAGKAWWMGQPMWHGKIGRGWRPEPVQMDQITPTTPAWNGFAWGGRMKYACIVYLRKSISFPHLQINRYNGIVDIDLAPYDIPNHLKTVSLVLWIFFFLYKMIEFMKTNLFFVSNQELYV